MRKRKIIMLLLIGWLVPFLAFAQADSKRVTLRLQNATVKVFFDALHEQTGLNFVYNNEQAKELPPITLNVKDAKVSEVLDQVLGSTAFGYSIENNTVTLYKGNARQGEVKTVKGRVVDGNGDPLPGVNISIEGTKQGCTTNFNGEYTLKVPAQCRLVASFIGMETQTLAYNGQSQLNITMTEDSNVISEVVVDGYFTRKTEGFAGAVTTIKKEDLQKVHTGNIFTTLSALMPASRLRRTTSPVRTRTPCPTSPSADAAHSRRAHRLRSSYSTVSRPPHRRSTIWTSTASRASPS